MTDIFLYFYFYFFVKLDPGRFFQNKLAPSGGLIHIAVIVSVYCFLHKVTGHMDKECCYRLWFLNLSDPSIRGWLYCQDNCRIQSAAK